eukprot:5134421-Lingulodinium_polyedra.AAC.1
MDARRHARLLAAAGRVENSQQTLGGRQCRLGGHVKGMVFPVNGHFGNLEPPTIRGFWPLV